jgi:hypothetical protein
MEDAMRIFYKSRRLRVALGCDNEIDYLLWRQLVSSALLMSDATREVLFFQLIEHFRSLGQLDPPQNIVLNWSKIQSIIQIYASSYK